MATSDVRAELECSVCLHTFTDPVNLTCGHTFCRHCIDRVLDTQETSGDYSCPECREVFAMRPTLHKNIALRKILENIVSADQKETRVLCTYCVDSSVPAVKSCLLCEAHLCEKHLRVHSKSPEHVLCDPTTSLQNRKCSIHKRILEYYCTEDSACICVSCRIDGAHEGHHVDRLDVASENRKKKLRDVLEKIMMMSMGTEERLQSLIDHERRSEEKVDGERERVNALFSELRRRLDDLEKRVLNELSGQAKKVSLALNDLFHELEIKNDELSRKMHHIEELCNMEDPLTFLQESDTGDLCNKGEGNYQQIYYTEIEDHLDFAGLSDTFHEELSTIMTELAEMMPASTAMNSASLLQERRRKVEKLKGCSSSGTKVGLSNRDRRREPCFVLPVKTAKESESSKRGDGFRNMFSEEENTKEERSEDEEQEDALVADHPVIQKPVKTVKENKSLMWAKSKYRVEDSDEPVKMVMENKSSMRAKSRYRQEYSDEPVKTVMENKSSMRAKSRYRLEYSDEDEGMSGFTRPSVRTFQPFKGTGKQDHCIGERPENQRKAKRLPKW